jgi:lipoprotein-anchoring transpeptidase ErfK/SrfK
VNIPKPANTAALTILPTGTPIAIPTDTPMPPPTVAEMPGEMVMEIVDNAFYESQAVNADPAPSYGGSKYILVDISEQHMYVYENEALVYSFVASTGMNNATRVGKFAVQSKIPNAYGSTWNIWMPSWLGIYWAGGLENGIHALPILPSGATLWAGFLGRPVSYGCVVLDTYDAQLLYDWAEIGTPVEIRR